MPESQSTTTSERTPGPDARRRTVHRSLLMRLLAVLVLVVFVVALGDYRRKSNGMGQAQRYAAALQDRIGDSQSLPQNLDPESFEGLFPSGVTLETLSREEVRTLRDRNEPIMIAWSVGLVQVLNRNGRAVVMFDRGPLTSEWLTEKEFQIRRAAQRATLNAKP